MPTPKKPATCPAQKHSYFKGRCVDCNQEKPASAEHSPFKIDKTEVVSGYAGSGPEGFSLTINIQGRGASSVHEAYKGVARIIDQGPAFDAMRETLGAIVAMDDAMPPQTKRGLTYTALMSDARAALALADKLTKGGR